MLEAVARLSDPIWRVDGGDVKNLQETDRVIFAQECGGFPLRALDNIRTMKEAYDAHIAAKGAVPLHIVRDEMAAKFPDIIPPKDEQLDRAVRLTGVGMALGIIVKEDRKIPQGPPTPMQLYCFKPDSGAVEWLGDTVEAVVNRLVIRAGSCRQCGSGNSQRDTNRRRTGTQAPNRKPEQFRRGTA